VTALSGGAEPALGSDAVNWQVVTTSMKRTQGEHGTAMALFSRCGEQLQGPIQVRGTTAAIRHHLGNCDLGLWHPSFGRSGKPGSRLSQIALHAVTFDEHPAVDILCIYHAVSRAPQPLRGQLFVALDPDASGQADAQIESGYQITGLCCLLEPLRNNCPVVCGTLLRQQQVRQICLRTSIPFLCGNAQPVRGLNLILNNAGAGEIECSQRAGGKLMPSFRSAAIPDRGLSVIWRHRPFLRVKITNECCCVWVACPRSAANPRFSVFRVFVDVHSFDEGKTPPDLRRPMPALGGIAKELHCGSGIAYGACPLFRKHTKKINRAGMPAPAALRNSPATRPRLSSSVDCRANDSA
jgi:hypothetical protein